MIAIYARVSTENQADTGTSLGTQVEACERKATELGYCVQDSHVYMDDSSGEYIDRDGLNALRRDIELNAIAGAVICYDPDRLSRNLHHQLLLNDEFRRYNIQLIFANSDNRRDTPEGMLLYHMQGAVAEYEKAKIRERTVRGKIARAKAGKIMPMRTPPYGYLWADGALYVNEEEAELVRNIFAWYLTGMSMRNIGTRLIESGVPARLGQWNASTIRNILQNQTYMGKYIYNRRRHERIPDKKTAGGRPAIREKQRPEAEHVVIEVPALIDETTWQQAQLQKTKNTIRSKRNTKLEYLARGGYLYCSDCGRALQNTSYFAGHGEKGYRVGVYRCPNLAPRNYATEKCPSNSVRSEYLDAFIWHDLITALLQPGNVQFIEKNDLPMVRDFTREHGVVETERAQLQKEKDKVVGLYRKDLLSVDDVERQLEKIKQKEEMLSKQLALLISQEQETPKKRMSEQEREAIFTQLRPLLEEQRENLSYDEKRFIFTQLVDRITVYLRAGLVAMRYEGVFDMETKHTYIPGQRRALSL